MMPLMGTATMLVASRVTQYQVTMAMQRMTINSLSAVKSSGYIFRTQKSDHQYDCNRQRNVLGHFLLCFFEQF